jgi:hypothetical protein
MLLADAEEVHHLAVEIVQNLDLRRLFAEKNLSASGKWLDIGCVFRKHLDDLLGNSTLAADIR